MSDSSPAHKPPIPSLRTFATPPKLKDPVCGMTVDPEKAAGKVQHAGAAASRTTSDENMVRYTCPMHPEIIRNGQGSCPICGMALEPLDVFAEVEADPEYDS